MHGLGNDFILVNACDVKENEFSALAAKLCRRRLSVGADGLIAVCPSDIADAKMRIDVYKRQADARPHHADENLAPTRGWLFHILQPHVDVYKRQITSMETILIGNHGIKFITMPRISSAKFSWSAPYLSLIHIFSVP